MNQRDCEFIKKKELLTFGSQLENEKNERVRDLGR